MGRRTSVSVPPAARATTPISPRVLATASFASYHSEPFGLEEHERLARAFAKLRKRGIATLLSNSDTDDTRRLFGRFALHTVHATRAINSNARKRGSVPEILVATSAR